MSEIKSTILMLSMIVIGTTFAIKPVTAEEKDIFDSLPGTFSADVAVNNDYVYRGTSQTDEHPALQGGIYWTRGFKTSNQDVALDFGIWG